MKFGIAFANIGPLADPEAAVALATAAEESGFDSIWTVEHVVVPQGYASTYPYSPDGRMPAPDDMALPDPLIWLTWVAAATRTIRLATGILILPQRNPLILAKEVATLDHLSGGRVTLGIGAGWLAEEFDALGIPFEDRGARTDDHIRALRAVWGQDAAEHHGTHSDFAGAVSRPKPVNGTVPIVVGGDSRAAARRAGRLGDGYFPGGSDHEQLAARLDDLRESALEAGRDPAAIEITAGGRGAVGGGALDEVKALADLGVSRVAIPPLAFDAASMREVLGRYGDEVIAKAG